MNDEVRLRLSGRQNLFKQSIYYHIKLLIIILRQFHLLISLQCLLTLICFGSVGRCGTLKEGKVASRKKQSQLVGIHTGGYGRVSPEVVGLVSH